MTPTPTPDPLHPATPSSGLAAYQQYIGSARGHCFQLEQLLAANKPTGGNPHQVKLDRLVSSPTPEILAAVEDEIAQLAIGSFHKQLLAYCKTQAECVTSQIEKGLLVNAARDLRTTASAAVIPLLDLVEGMADLSPACAAKLLDHCITLARG